MASENNGLLSNSYDTNNSINNCNNNENETSSSSSPSLLTLSGSNQKNDTTSAKLTADRNICGGDIVGNNCGGGDYKNIRATVSNEAHPTVEQHTRREENPFSFKHFLNRDTSSISLGSSSNSNSNVTSSSITTATATATATATFIPNTTNASSTVLSSELLYNNSNNNSNSEEININNRSSSINSDASKILSGNIQSTQTIVGPSSNTTPSSSSSQPYKTSTGARPKVPQSTSSSNQYNHQLQQQSQQNPLPSTSVSTTSMSSLVGETCKMKRSPRFSSFDSQASLAEYAGSGLNGSGNFRDVMQLNSCLDGEPNDSMNNFFNSGNGSGVSRNYDRQQYVHRSISNYDMDLPPKDCEGEIASPRHRLSPTRSNRSSSSGMPPSSNSKNHPGSVIGGGGVGSGLIGPRPNSEFSNVLPDFVQDHWMDQWYYNDMNLSSPPNSPISPVDFVEDFPGMSNLSDKCQTLPDFLSDGPIHSSSARLADVAAGLPPDLDSPEDNSPSLQLSRLRLENDRLRRELDESRLALAEQTRRAGELERRLEQARSNELAYNRSSAQNAGNLDESLEQSKKRNAAAQSQILKLKQQVKQLTTDIDVLRRENESLREDGAVGGDRIVRRPSRTQQLSKDLMRAASNAESNLRQLLTGVENLRLMAATIENMDQITIESSNQANPLINEELHSDSDVDFDDFSGPAL